MRDNISDLASIGPKDDHKRAPAGVCRCGIYVPPEHRADHQAEHERRQAEAFAPVSQMLRDIGGLK